jgi:hypothetical protein
MSVRRWGITLAALLALATLLPGPASAIPAFARRYKVSCQTCHDPFPKLNDFGAQFAANGYRMSPTEEPMDTIGTGDELLALMKDVPLAVRLEMYAQAYANGDVATDFQYPYGVKVLSGGAISKKISYYFYTFLVERGDIGGVEDAFLHINDIGGVPFDLAVGQFQVSDPLFKRELRLEFEDYAVYRARVGDVPVDLTYDRGLMGLADLAGFTVTAEVLNGSGIGGAQANRRYDTDASKNFFLHVTRDPRRAAPPGHLRVLRPLHRQRHHQQDPDGRRGWHRVARSGGAQRAVRPPPRRRAHLHRGGGRKRG